MDNQTFIAKFREKVNFLLATKAPLTFELKSTTIDLRNLIDEYEKSYGINAESLLSNICQTVERKNSDYSKQEDAFANFERVEKEFGIPTEDGMKVRILDKISRRENLKTKEPAVVGESLGDTILDLIGYLLIYQLYKENH